ncbi:MAG: urease accessory protein UreJ [Hyphomicrobiaceae bacterium]|nr:urease accessory protein UreJ [Hyphomicrobiaceae bacterium]
MMPIIPWQNVISKFVILIFTLGISHPAFAHHPMGGEVMTTFGQGVLSGLAHPVIEFDHLGFLIALGLLLVGQSRVVIHATIFTVWSMIGVAGRYSIGAPLGLEVIVAGSIIAAGLLLLFDTDWRGRGLRGGLIGGLAFAGLAHGLAFGESVIGTETSVVGGYLVGLAIIQILLVIAVSRLGRALVRSRSSAAFGLRAIGVLIAIFGVLQLSSLLTSA